MKSISGTNPRRQRAQIRRIYEKYPYPAANRSSLTAKRWHLAPMEWIMALWRPGNESDPPKRILVAGCGSGSEAFALARKFPASKIVAADFSPRSIAIAKKLQRQSARTRNIRFVRADLTSRSLSKTTGGDFDFISCHGVLSYIPGTGARAGKSFPPAEPGWRSLPRRQRIGTFQCSRAALSFFIRIQSR